MMHMVATSRKPPNPSDIPCILIICKFSSYSQVVVTQAAIRVPIPCQVCGFCALFCHHGLHRCHEFFSGFLPGCFDRSCLPVCWSYWKQVGSWLITIPASYMVHSANATKPSITFHCCDRWFNPLWFVYAIIIWLSQPLPPHFFKIPFYFLSPCLTSRPSYTSTSLFSVSLKSLLRASEAFGDLLWTVTRNSMTLLSFVVSLPLSMAMLCHLPNAFTMFYIIFSFFFSASVACLRFSYSYSLHHLQFSSCSVWPITSYQWAKTLILVA